MHKDENKLKNMKNMFGKWHSLCWWQSAGGDCGNGGGAAAATSTRKI